MSIPPTGGWGVGVGGQEGEGVTEILIQVSYVCFTYSVLNVKC